MLVASYRDGTSPFARAAFGPRLRPELAGSGNAEAAALRARAARYRRLAESLYDLRVIAEVHACARELDAEAVSIEGQSRIGARRAVPQYRVGRN